MNIEQQIRASKSTFPQRVVDKKRMKQNVLRAVRDDAVGRNERRTHPVWRRWSAVSGIGIVGLIGSCMGLSLVSPSVLSLF